MHNKTLKIKDNRNIALLVIAFCILPLVFMFISVNVSHNYITGFIVTLILYVIFFVWYLRDLKKREDDYAIIADSEGVTFKKLGSYKWNEIVSIETFRKINWLRSSYEEKYLRITFRDKNSSIIIKTSSYDLGLEELASDLRLLGGLDKTRAHNIS